MRNIQGNISINRTIFGSVGSQGIGMNSDHVIFGREKKFGYQFDDSNPKYLKNHLKGEKCDLTKGYFVILFAFPPEVFSEG